jgi:hypothetical protein
VQKEPVGSSEAAEISVMCDPLPSLAGFSVNWLEFEILFAFLCQELVELSPNKKDREIGPVRPQILV